MRILLVHEGRIVLNQLAKYFKYLDSHVIEVATSERQFRKTVQDYRPEIVIVASCVTGNDVASYYNTKIRARGSEAYLIVIVNNGIDVSVKDNRIAGKVYIIGAAEDDEGLVILLDRLSLIANVTHGASKQYLKELTTAENRVISQIIEGKCTDEIAVNLRISVNTVKNHRKSIKSKLGIRGGKTALLEYLSYFA